MATIATASACQIPPKCENLRIEELCRRSQKKLMWITSPAYGSCTGIQVDVQGKFDGYFPYPCGGWWILVEPLGSKLTHPGAPIDFSGRRCKGIWKGLHSIYLTGDPNQLKQSFKIMIAWVTPQTDQLYRYRLEHQIYDYIEIQPKTRIYDYIIVQRLQQ
jgi:hypothetical protein